MPPARAPHPHTSAPASHAHSVRRPRRGLLSLELLITLPILVVLIGGLVEFGSLLVAYRSIARASTTGAHLAATGSINPNDVTGRLRSILGDDLAEVATIQCHAPESSNEQIACEVRVPMTACAPNLLRPLGFDLEGESLRCTSTAVVR